MLSKSLRAGLMALAAALALYCLWLAVKSAQPPQAVPLTLLPQRAAAAMPVSPSGPLDVNTATKEELMALPGIGPSLADAILAARAVCPFYYPEDLRAVPGIGEKRLAALRPLICVCPIDDREGGL